MKSQGISFQTKSGHPVLGHKLQHVLKCVLSKILFLKFLSHLLQGVT